MDEPTVVVAIAGIAGTLLAAVLSPLVSERMGRKSAKLDRLTSERLLAYADLTRATARLADNAMNWSALPLADFPETDNDEMDRIIARARVASSKRVYDQLSELADTLGVSDDTVRRDLAPDFANAKQDDHDTTNEQAEEPSHDADFANAKQDEESLWPADADANWSSLALIRTIRSTVAACAL